MDEPEEHELAQSDIAALLTKWLGQYGDTVSGSVLLDMVLDMLGSRVIICDAIQYIYKYGRQQGYELPAYPLAGCGEIKSLFKDFGVSDIPGFYKRIGVSPEDYAHLPEKTLVVMRNHDNMKKALLLDLPFYKIDAAIGRRRYGDIEAQIRSQLPMALNEQQAMIVAKWLIEFDLSYDSSDPTLFT